MFNVNSSSSSAEEVPLRRVILFTPVKNLGLPSVHHSAVPDVDASSDCHDCASYEEQKSVGISPSCAVTLSQIASKVYEFVKQII